MNTATIVAIAAPIAMVLVGLFVYAKDRTANKIRAGEVDSKAAIDILAANVELNRYIDEKVEAAVAPIREEVRKLRDREAVVTAIIRRFFQRLFRWSEDGQDGPMPKPTDDEMKILGITDISDDTLTPAELRDIRTRANQAEKEKS
jgi:hypothetical protein